jgi:hypothetical protein
MVVFLQEAMTIRLESIFPQQGEHTPIIPLWKKFYGMILGKALETGMGGNILEEA